MDKKINNGYICSKHNIGYITKCPTCESQKEISLSKWIESYKGKDEYKRFEKSYDEFKKKYERFEMSFYDFEGKFHEFLINKEKFNKFLHL